jgi:hypothetical protein
MSENVALLAEMAALPQLPGASDIPLGNRPDGLAEILRQNAQMKGTLALLDPPPAASSAPIPTPPDSGRPERHRRRPRRASTTFLLRGCFMRRQFRFPRDVCCEFSDCRTQRTCTRQCSGSCASAATSFSSGAFQHHSQGGYSAICYGAS